MVKAMAMTSETFLFFFLGTEFTMIPFKRQWRSILLVLVAIYLARIFVTISLTYLINLTRSQTKINWKWQIMIIVGGLRGAVAFAMTVHYNGPFKYSFYEFTVAAIFITTILNGIAAKPLVVLFNLRQKTEDGSDDSSEGNLESFEEDENTKYISKLYSAFEKKFLEKQFTKIGEHKKQPTTENSRINSSRDDTTMH